MQFIAGVPLFGIFWLWIPISFLYAIGICFARRRYA